MKTIIIKKEKLIEARNHFEINNGRFNLDHFVKVLKAKGIDASKQIEIFQSYNIVKA